MFRGDPKAARLIFPPYEGYTDFENEKYEEFEEYIEENGIEFPSWITKRHKLRAIQGEDYKVDVAARRLGEVLEWKTKTFPMVLTDNQKTLLDAGLFYTHGRDKSLRPIVIFDPKVILEYDIGLEESLPACQFVSNYIIEHMFYIGKVENFTNILDLGKLSFNALPKAWIIAFIKSFSSTTYARSRKMFLLNAGTAVSMMWAIVKMFVHHTTKKKMIFSSKSTEAELQQSCHPSQLQKKYGGEAEDITVFWPPYSASDEYAVDIKKLKNKNEYDASVAHDEPLVLPHILYETRIDEGVTHKIDYVDTPQIQLQLEDEERATLKLATDERRARVKKAKKSDTKNSCCVIF